MQTTAQPAPSSSAPVLDVDPFSDEVLNDPYETYAAIRDAGPVVYLSRYQNYAVARHKEAQAVLRDWQNFSSALAGIGLADVRKPDAWRPKGPIVEADPPDHTKARQLLQRLLSANVVRSWREAFEREADEMIKGLVEAGRFDGVVDVAEAFVYTVFPREVGLAPTEGLREKLSLIGSLNFDGLGPKNERFLETAAKVAEFMPWYNKSYQRENMVPGGFGELIFKAGDDGEVDPAICPGLLHSFLRGGMDTTVSAIGSVLWILATQPDKWAALKASPALVKSAIDEIIRFESPISSFYRTTTKAVEVAGVRIPAEAKMQVFLGSANRDPRHWERPDEFDLNRTTAGHVAFGFGIHMCVGQMIAKLEGEAVLKSLLARASSIELDAPPVRRLNNCMRGFKSVPLKVRAV